MERNLKVFRLSGGPVDLYVTNLNFSHKAHPLGSICDHAKDVFTFTSNKYTYLCSLLFVSSNP